MKTQRLLVIASVERTGSTLLCSILRGTQAAGAPEEYLNIQTKNFARLRKMVGAPKLRLSQLPMALARLATGRYPWKDISSFSQVSFRDYLLAVARERTTPNGVFGVKMHWNQYKRHMLDLGFDMNYAKQYHSCAPHKANRGIATCKLCASRYTTPRQLSVPSIA
jgi:LPS sulfotransferase NodH